MKKHLKDPANLYSLEVPFSRKSESTLGDQKSICIKLSLDAPDIWPNCIFENSRYAIFMWHQNQEKMLLLSCGLGMSKKFRQQKCTSGGQFLDKINKYIAAQV